MKKPQLIKYVFLLFIGLLIFKGQLLAQDESDPPKKIIKLQYYNIDNNIQYLLLESTLKAGKVLLRG
jgi:hypothetical protein